MTSILLTGAGPTASSGGGAAYDTDAQTYITAVESADGQSLETGVKDAINAFVVGCKSDGIWTSIKASCILAGARTLSGALVPLVGTAPTNNNFVSGDYSRTAGLTGDGSTKYLNTNLTSAAAGSQNDFSFSLYGAAATLGGTKCLMGVSASRLASIQQQSSITNINFSVNGSESNQTVTAPAGVFLAGASRSSASAFDFRWNGVSASATNSSTGTIAFSQFVFARNASGTPGLYANNRCLFYHIGTALNLATLESRASTLITSIGAAIP